MTSTVSQITLVLSQCYSLPLSHQRLQNLIKTQQKCAQWCVSKVTPAEVFVKPILNPSVAKKEPQGNLPVYGLLYSGMYCETVSNLVENADLCSLPLEKLHRQSKYIDSPEQVHGVRNAVQRNKAVYFTLAFRQHVFGVFVHQNEIHVLNTLTATQLVGGSLVARKNMRYYEFVKSRVFKLATRVTAISDATFVWHDLGVQGKSDCMFWCIVLPYILPQLVPTANDWNTGMSKAIAYIESGFSYSSQIKKLFSAAIQEASHNIGPISGISWLNVPKKKKK